MPISGVPGLALDCGANLRGLAVQLQPLQPLLVVRLVLLVPDGVPVGPCSDCDGFVAIDCRYE